MKPLSGKFLALDLEMNKPSGRIIQVGIALGGANQSPDEYIVRQWLVDPGEPISPEITALTGIADADLQARAVPWARVAAELGEIASQPGVFVNPVTWGGGDSELLLSSFKNQAVTFPHFGRRWVDVKTFHVLLSLTQGKTPRGGLSSVMGRYGLRFQGQPHRADVDAFNTLRLFFKLLERQHSLESMAAIGKEV
jgi:DNA polymerase III epsilon subunit-like protein